MSKQQPPVAPANRVRVAVRCRPPFEEEGQGATAVRIVRPPPTGSVISLPRTLQIDISSEKCREFSFDAVFGAEASNNEVYDVVAGPICKDSYSRNELLVFSSDLFFLNNKKSC